eukprot:TRINITY_DN1164_c0_g1_i18.p1 TRINITY_DN1164_c0_g1~~TRINITY_DN1164_c0_g1_i18.p1  ORF type:complete len:102 (+),score=26.34 TRINITY_DN1164_c0_g1_i18:1-306(+)
MTSGWRRSWKGRRLPKEESLERALAAEGGKSSGKSKSKGKGGWLPDDVWLAQKLERALANGGGSQSGGKSYGKGKSKGKGGWLPDDVWLAQKLEKALARGW